MAYYSNKPSRGRGPQRRSGGFQGSRSSAPKRGKKGEYINPARFVKAATPVKVADYKPTHEFTDFAIADILKKNIADKGLITPSPIQDKAIPVGLTGRDVIGIANTGTGKTIAFAIPVMQGLIADRSAKALIMAPTRELAQQIEQECRAVGKGTGLVGALLIGGMPMGPQLRDLRYNPRIIIGTPGRIKDHMQRGSLDLAAVSMVVLDEVDRMLDMGFVHDMRTILGKLRADRQSFFFSATMDERVRSLIDTFAQGPEMISVKSGVTSENVHQDVVRYGSKEEKIEKLHDLLIGGTVGKAIVFDETQRSVERLNRTLQERGFKADAIHGGKTQGQRKRALDKFKANEINMLVATDVAARGIDVADITHVINFTTPQSYEDYVHRIGRAGRAGRTGYALTFVEHEQPRDTFSRR